MKQRLPDNIQNLLAENTEIIVNRVLQGLAIFLVCFLYAVPLYSFTDAKKESTGLEDKAVVTEEPYMTKEFEVNCPGLLKVFTVAGNIDIRPSPTADNVRVELYLDRGFAFWSNAQNLDNFRIAILQRNNEIIASVERKKRETGFFSDRMRFSFRVYVPERMSTYLKTLSGNISLQHVRGKQMMKTGGGNIRASDIDGRLEAFTAGGDITIQQTKGTIYAQSQGGDISMDHTSGELRLKTSGGRIVADRTSGTMLARVEGGDIWMDFVDVGQGINLEATAGNIHLDIPDYNGYDLFLRGTRVEFTDLAQVEGTKESGYMKGAYKGGGPPIDLNTNSGRIIVNIK